MLQYKDGANKAINQELLQREKHYYIIVPAIIKEKCGKSKRVKIMLTFFFLKVEKNTVPVF